MSCEYSFEGTRGDYEGILCKLTNKACFADQEQPMGHTACIRREWANKYAAKLVEHERAKIAPK